MTDLYQAGAGLLEASGRQASDIANRKQEETRMAVGAGTAAAGELGADRRQAKELEQQRSQAQMQLQQLKLKRGIVPMSPQMALGIFNINKDNPSLIQLAGQELDPQEVAGIIGGEYKKAEMKLKAPKTFRMRVGSNDVDGIIEWDEATQSWTPKPISAGGPHFDPNKGGGGSGPGSKVDKAEADARKAFIASYEKREADLARDRKSLTYDPTNADLKSKVQKDQSWLSDNRPKYDQLTGKQAEAGGYEPPAVGAGGDDIDAIFNESFGGGQ